MAWEVFTRQVLRTEEPTVSISKLGRLAFNKAATLTFKQKGITHIAVLWDKETHSCGVRAATPKDIGAYRLAFGENGGSAGFSAVTFLNFIRYDWTETRSFACRWDEEAGLLVFSIPLEHFGAPGNRRQPLGKIKRPDRLKTSEAKQGVELPK